MSHSFFEDILDEAQVMKIVACMKFFVPSSHAIIKEGDIGNRFYILEAGKLEVTQV